MTGAAAGSALARLRKARADGARDRHVDVQVPDTTDTYLRLGFLDPDEIEKIGRRVQGKKQRARTGDTYRHNVAVLVEACRGVFVVAEDGSEVSLDEQDTSGDPSRWLRIGPRLGELLEVPDADATAVLEALLGGKWEVQAVCARYNEWLIPEAEVLDQEQQGE